MTNQSLKKMNTWRVGGTASQIYKPANLSDLHQFIKRLDSSACPIFLGLGSNVLIADSGVSEPIILTQGGIDALEMFDENTFRAEAGVTCAKAAKFCVKNDLLNGEFFAGIPGTVGGALSMNAGAFGGETWQYVVAVETIDRQGNIHVRSPEEYQVTYRHVTYLNKHADSPEWFVAGHFRLPKGDGQVTANNIKGLLRARSEKQPIGLPSCGSVFKNPKNCFAAQLIESCGLKGMKIGGAEVSEKHANFIINTGTASSDDIYRLIKKIRSVVKAEKGVLLEPEVCFIGQFG